jgi:YihY family inner membrane protein
MRSGSVWKILKTAIDSFRDVRGSHAAAGLSYYAFLSLFPLLLVLVSVGSLFLKGDSIQRLLILVTGVIPLSRSLIERNLQQVLEQRGAIGLVGIVALIWSASGAFSVLITHINLAWPEARQRGLLQRRFLAIGLVVVLFLLLILSVISSMIVNLLSQFKVPILGEIAFYETFVWRLLSDFFPWLFSVLIFMGLYRWLPNTHVHWSEAFWGALLSATAWKIATFAFTWYLSSGLSRYELIYGSLGAVIALLFVIYVSSWITLFGAHLSSAIQRTREKIETG